jgi:hypothetical protein
VVIASNDIEETILFVHVNHSKRKFWLLPSNFGMVELYFLHPQKTHICSFW